MFSLKSKTFVDLHTPPLQSGNARRVTTGELMYVRLYSKVPPPQGPGEDAFSVHLGRFVPEGL